VDSNGCISKKVITFAACINNNLKSQKSIDMKVIVPPIKSQGIKTKLIPWIKDIAPKVNGRWIEPFLGDRSSCF
jgi:hypothetical protein